ncbi:MAG: transglutaminase-like domain-containing protein [Rikenellaceae bacterium]
MKKILLSFALIAMMLSCSSPFSGVSEQTKAAAELALSNASEERATEFKKALEIMPENQREGLAYLIAYMPKTDLDTLSIALITKNVELAYKARETFPWAKAIPEDVFLNDVLPYASMDETRENWRESFLEMLTPIVQDKQTIREAIDTVNRALIKLVNVKYSTKRKKPNQSPAESMELGLASCSGLSILLTDAFRAVGIPSRIAGTPMWVTREGNHNWSEVYIDGEWLFTEYNYTPLNHGWFLAKASRADSADPQTWIYATAFKPTELHFPMVWSRNDKTVPGVDVTQRYRDTYAAQVKEKEKGTPLNIKMYTSETAEKTSQNRVKTEIKIKDAQGEVVASGNSVDVTADMNDYFTAYIKDPKQEYTIEWKAKNGTKTQKIKVAKETTIELYFE